MGRDARLALIALLVIQIGIGYEWFMSGLTKIYRGGFASAWLAVLAFAVNLALRRAIGAHARRDTRTASTAPR